MPFFLNIRSTPVFVFLHELRDSQMINCEKAANVIITACHFEVRVNRFSVHS